VGANGVAADAATTPTTVTFDFTGANQSFVVPAGVTSISVEGFGAQGGNGGTCFGLALVTTQECGDGGTGGMGAHVTSTIAVTPGETLTVIVGGKGGDATDAQCETPGTPGQGGFDGGANGAVGGCPAGAGGGGGGSTRLFRGATAIFVAGGG